MTKTNKQNKAEQQFQRRRREREREKINGLQCNGQTNKSLVHTDNHPCCSLVQELRAYREQREQQPEFGQPI